MPQFRYVAKNKSGRTISGRKEASSKEKLILELTRQNLTIVSIEDVYDDKKNIAKVLHEIPIGGGGVKTFELIVFCRQLATMLHGGVPILRAIESISFETRDKNFKSILHNVLRDLGDGKMISEGLKKHSRVFSPLFIAIVEAGERVGSLDKMLFRLSNYLEARDRLIRKLRAATAYPSFIAGFFLCAIVGITVFLVPRFQKVYERFGAKLPPLTRFVFNLSEIFVKNAPIILFVGIASIFSIWFFIKHTRKGRGVFDRMVLGLPLFGTVIKKAAVSTFCRTMATLLSQGIPITEAFLLVGRTAGNLSIEEASNKASKLVMEGETIPDALTKMKLFPPLMLQMVSVGTDSGSLPELLDKTADFYEEQVDAFISTLTALIEPVLIIVLGVFIAIVVIAMYLPIFKLGTALVGGGG